MSFLPEKDAAVIYPPVFGKTVAVNCSPTVQVVDLTSLPGNPFKTGDPASQNPVGHYVKITAQGGDIYYVTGNNFAQLNAIPNTVLFTTVNTTTGKVTIQGNEVDYIAAGTYEHFVVPLAGQATTQSPPGSGSPARYVALLTASGNATARIRQSGP